MKKSSLTLLLPWVRRFPFGALLLFVALQQNTPGIAAPLKTNEPIYQNPFDLASGGASLTRTTQDGAALVNPSLPAFGRGLLRWIYLRQSIHVGADAVDLAKSAAQQKGLPNNFSAADALKTPIHFGLDISTGVLTSRIGVGAFSATRFDIEGSQFGRSGMPEIKASVVSMNGGVVSSSWAFSNIFALGVSAKYLKLGWLDETFGLGDLTAGGNLLSDIKNRVIYGSGLAYDVGTTTQWQNRFFDARFAFVVSDLFTTKFKGNVPSWPQSYHAGVGTTWHTSTSAVHCSADLRDLTTVYGEHWTKRFYTGCKVLFSGLIGVGGGFYQGWPTAGVVLNLWLMRLEAGTYTRELSRSVGLRGRRVYFVTFGFEI